jgi:hypothetical protein
MTKKTFFGAMAVVTAAALTGTALVASNMGFKLNYALNQGGTGGSLSGQRTLALPDNRQTGLVDAKNLMDDIGSVNTTNVQRWLIGSDVFAQYTGRKTLPSTPFNMVSGEGILVKMLTTVNYIVVGSDDPSLVYQMKALGTGGSLSGQNLYAYNYHQTATDAKSLMDDIGSANVTNVQRWLVGSDVFQQYTGRKTLPSTSFTLTPGEAYLIKMLTTVNYTPSHY